MKIEAGKRYVRRDGEISGVISAQRNIAYPFLDTEANASYSASGSYSIRVRHPWDLIREYTPTPSTPDPQEHGEVARIAQDAPDGQSGVNTPTHAPQTATSNRGWQQEAIESLSTILAVVASGITIADGSPFLDRIRDIIRRSGIQSDPITPPNLSD